MTVHPRNWQLPSAEGREMGALERHCISNALSTLSTSSYIHEALGDRKVFVLLVVFMLRWCFHQGQER